MTDTIEITLPVSNKVVVIRNYTTRNDDEKAEDTLYLGVAADQTSGVDGDSRSVKFPLANVMASQDVYVKRLVSSIDGDSTNIRTRLGELRTADYQAIEAAVEKIVETNSPKASEAKKASPINTNEK